MSVTPGRYIAEREKSTTKNEKNKQEWKYGKTTTIRIPEKFAHRLLEIAHQWDEENPCVH